MKLNSDITLRIFWRFLYVVGGSSCICFIQSEIFCDILKLAKEVRITSSTLNVSRICRRRNSCYRFIFHAYTTSTSSISGTRTFIDVRNVLILKIFWSIEYQLRINPKFFSPASLLRLSDLDHSRQQNWNFVFRFVILFTGAWALASI